ncbi:MAG: hypothetical protein LBS04_04140, partial [Tannerellaceae bacterium]|nr:hypothetical protein [Tannerellaceae bacterium]
MFAVFKPKNVFSMLVCGAIFITSNTACYAVTIKGYQPLAVCCASNVGKCSLARMGEDSLLFYIYFNFSSRMPKNEKDYSGANNSNVDVTSTHETGHNPQKRKRTTRVSCQEARPEIQVIH